MCVCLTYCCLFKLQFVNMRECVCLWLRHTPTKPHTAYRSSSIRPNFFSDTNTQLYLCLLRCLSLSPFSGLRGGLTIKLLVQSLTAHNLGQPVLRPNLADIVGPLVYPFPLTSALPSVQQQKQLGKEWGATSKPLRPPGSHGLSYSHACYSLLPSAVLRRVTLTQKTFAGTFYLHPLVCSKRKINSILACFRLS